MRNKHSGSFFDDFLGNAVVADRYSIDDTNGTVELMQDGPNRVDGVLSLAPGPDEDDFVSVSTGLEMFTRAKNARFLARFRIPQIDGIYFELGFWYDLSNYIVLKVDSETDRLFHVEASVGGVKTEEDFDLNIDADWHDVEIRLPGRTADAEVVLDNNVADKVTVADADLPDTPFCLRAYAQMTTAGVSQVRKLFVDYWGAHQPRDPSLIVAVTDPGGMDQISAMGQHNDFLHIGRGSSMGGATARLVQRRNIDDTWTSLGAPSATANRVSVLYSWNGELHAGHDDEDEIYEWVSGTSWTPIGTLTGATGCASLRSWVDSPGSDYLYAGTIGNPGDVMYLAAGTWYSIADAGWPTGMAAVMLAIHDGELYAYHGGDGRVYVYDGVGSSWTDCGQPGSSTPTTTRARHLFSFKGSLYAFDTINKYLYRWNGGTSWTQVRLFTTACSVASVNNDGLFHYVDTGAGALMRSHDGASWRNFATLTGLTDPQHIAIADGAVFVGDTVGKILVVR